MPLAAYFYWAILKLEYTVTATGVKIVATTNHACHLTMRWTTHDPWKHITDTLLRGAPLGKDLRICFVAFDSNEQKEAHDTYIHTFTKEPWAHCETRWFYFYATVEEEFSPSESPIFKYHRVYVPVPTTVTFYPDAHPEVTSVDGEVVHGAYVSFLTLRNAAGTAGYPSRTFQRIKFWAWSPANIWFALYRVIVLFDTSSIPVGATILSATLSLYPGSKVDNLNLGDTFKINVYSSAPASNTNLVAGDYDSLGIVPFSVAIPHGDIILGEYNDWELNAAGLAAINPGGITKLGLREQTYDVGAVAPPWLYRQDTTVSFYSADRTSPEPQPPKLTITYIP